MPNEELIKSFPMDWEAEIRDGRFNKKMADPIDASKIISECLREDSRHFNMGEHAVAVEKLKKALNALATIADALPVSEVNYLAYNCYVNMCNHFVSLNQYDAAIIILHAAEAVAKNIHNGETSTLFPFPAFDEKCANAYLSGNLGYCFNEFGQYALAEYYYQKSISYDLSYYENTKDRTNANRQLSIDYYNMGSNYFVKNDFVNALMSFQKCAEASMSIPDISKTSADQQDIADAYTFAGDACLMKHSYKDAIPYYLLAIDHYLQISYLVRIIVVLEKMAFANIKCNDLDSAALNYQQAYNHIAILAKMGRAPYPHQDRLNKSCYALQKMIDTRNQANHDVMMVDSPQQEAQAACKHSSRMFVKQPDAIQVDEAPLQQHYNLRSRHR